MPRFVDYAIDTLSMCDNKFIHTFLPVTQSVAIENVSDFFYKSDTGFDLSDFPNCAPPFENFLMEHNYEILGGRKALVGNLFLYVDCRDSRVFDFVRFMFHGNSQVIDDVTSRLSKAKWFVWVNHGIFNHSKFVDWYAKTVFLVRDDGVILSEKDFVFFSTLPKEVSSSGMLGILYPSLLALSFMHCKNVTVEQVTPDAPVSKKYEKKHGRPLEKYHILNIEPMKKVLKIKGNSEKTGLKQALHICRGHFKDFSEGKGLFGKFKGLYWWDSQVRGSHEHGIIDKDYNVKKPKESKD